jgi:hypothetical protein
MKKLTHLLPFLFLAFACEKDEDNGTKSKKDLLTKSSWVQITLKTRLSGTTTNFGDQFPTLDACRKDNRSKFNADQSYQVDEGPTKCSANATQIRETGTWYFNANETEITSTETGTNVSWVFQGYDYEVSYIH